MAEIAPTITRIETYGDHAHVITWANLELNETIAFTGGDTNVNVGDTLTQGAVTATIEEIDIATGTLGGGDAAGTFTLSGRAGGNFAAGAATTTGGGTVTLGGAQTTVKDTGVEIEMPGSADRSIQFEGTFGAAGEISIEGSNDGSNWFLLTDPQGTDISKTAASIEAIAELTRYIRPAIVAGEAFVTTLDATLLVKRK